jgi:hypothetical protein
MMERATMTKIPLTRRRFLDFRLPPPDMVAALAAKAIDGFIVPDGGSK